MHDRPQEEEEEVVLHEADGGHRVVRVGPEVRRRMYPSAPAVHELLRHLERVRFDGAPRLLGIDGPLERLTYIDGEGGTAGWDGSPATEPRPGPGGMSMGRRHLPLALLGRAADRQVDRRRRPVPQHQPLGDLTA